MIAYFFAAIFMTIEWMAIIYLNERFNLLSCDRFTSIGKKYFRQGSYGLAERHFRKAVELHPRDAEAWLGLAAAYDRLKRFDLADRAYTQAVRLIGPTPDIMNNQGFSYLLRGDYGRARAMLLAAQAKDPKSPYIANNIRLLEESAHKAKGVN